MKKIIYLLICILLVLMFNSCSEKDSFNYETEVDISENESEDSFLENENETTSLKNSDTREKLNISDDNKTNKIQNDKKKEYVQYPREIPVEDFIKDVEGYWVFAEHNGYTHVCEVLEFNDDYQMSTYVYEGCGDRNATITKVVEKSEDDYTLELYFPRLEDPEGFYGSAEGFLPEYTTTCSISTNDDFAGNIILNDYSYTYAGYTWEQLEIECSELLENLPTMLIEYIGKTVQNVLDDFGDSYYINPLNGGMAVYYDDVAFRYSNYVDFNSTVPEMNSIISHITVFDDEVYNGIRIGDKLETVRTKIGIDSYDGKFTARSYIGNVVITWNIDPIEKEILMAFIDVR